MISNKKILVTGGAGFIGSNLCERLLDLGNAVVCFDSLITGKIENIQPLFEYSKFSFIQGDLRNMEDCERAVAGVDLVLHQAALGSVPRSIADPITTNAINITGFLNMIEATRKAGIKRFVYAASSSTYGDSPNLPKVEAVIGKPLSPYAVTKYVNELYAGVYHKLYGLEVIGLRYFNVFGRKQDPKGAYAAAIPKFIFALMNHTSPEIYGDGLQSRDFTYIENVIEANLLAGSTTNEAAIGEVFNVAYGENTTLLELTTELKSLLSGYDAAIGEVEIKHAPERLGDIKHSLASIDKAKTLLGYNPQFGLNKGLTEAIDWYWKEWSGK